MFERDITITGTYGWYMHRITGDLDISKNKFFRTGYDVYRVSAILGFLYGKKGDKSITKAEKGSKPFTIFAGQMNNIRDDLMFNYRLIMLLDEKYEPDFNERLQKAFNYYGDEEKSKYDKELFEQYSLGGIEILYEKLIENANKQEDYLSNLFYFIQEFEQRYNAEIDNASLIELCRKISVQ